MAIVVGIAVVALGTWQLIAPASSTSVRRRPLRRWRIGTRGGLSPIYLALLRAQGAALILFGVAIIVVPMLSADA